MKKVLFMGIVGCLLTLLACTPPQQRYSELYQQARTSFMQQDYTKAFRLVQAPAKGGNPDAQYALGYMYYYGKGTVEDRQQAVYWFRLAAQQGQKDAQRALTMMKQQ